MRYTSFYIDTNCVLLFVSKTIIFLSQFKHTFLILSFIFVWHKTVLFLNLSQLKFLLDHFNYFVTHWTDTIMLIFLIIFFFISCIQHFQNTTLLTQKKPYQSIQTVVKSTKILRQQHLNRIKKIIELFTVTPTRNVTTVER